MYYYPVAICLLQHRSFGGNLLSLPNQYFYVFDILLCTIKNRNHMLNLLI